MTSRTPHSQSAGSRPNDPAAPPETRTLGVLLVHGIGAQRRGDVLVPCVTALHKWLREWLTQGYFGKDIAIDLVDANVTGSGPDHPAQRTHHFSARQRGQPVFGDSYLFVTSPITGAAVFTRVQKDMEWLAARCDRVIVVAHSQGAAVSYRVIEREFWGGHAPEKLHSLVTYGAGLRKLFDLEQTEHSLRFWILLGTYAMAISASMAGLIALCFAGLVPWWAALLGVALGVVLQMFPLVGPNRFVVDPAVLRVTWHDYYSSHDPVPSGPIDFKRQELEPETTIERAVLSYMDSVVVEAFTSRQREVVNRRSIVFDHTSYWSSDDDFVARLAGVLADASDIPIHLTLDEEWLKISAERRRWRVTWLSRCRAVAGLVAISVLLWPRAVLEPVGSRVRDAIGAASEPLPEKLIEWTPLIPGWALGATGLVLVTYMMFLLAALAWRIWDGQELQRFFLRSPHATVGFALRAFAVGWIGVLAAAPLVALVHAPFDWAVLLMVAWAPAALAVWSARIAIKSGSGPGTPQDCGRRALSQAEQLLAGKGPDRIDALRGARFCFQMSQKWLQSGCEEWKRAVLGETRVVEELARADSNVRDEAAALYRKAIETLEQSGQDASEVRARVLATP